MKKSYSQIIIDNKTGIVKKRSKKQNPELASKCPDKGNVFDINHLIWVQPKYRH